MTLKEQVFEKFEKTNSTLVFPTDIICRYYLDLYVREKNLPILDSRAMSFDNFRSLFISIPQGKNKADDFSRLAFVSYFLEKTSIPSFYQSKYEASKNVFKAYLASILPSIMSYRSRLPKDGEHRRDILTIKKEYNSFLTNNGYYEENSIAPVIPEGFKSENYVLVGSNEELPMKAFLGSFSSQDFNFEYIDPEFENLGKSALDKVSYYNNERAELLSLFDQLSLLREEGSSIILSTPEPDRLRPYLQQLSSQYSIPLDFITTEPISKGVPGLYLKSLSSLISEDLTFSSLEAFLLNSVFPFKEEVRTFGKTIIMFLIDRNLFKGSLQGSDEIEKQLEKEQKEALNFYRELKDCLLALKNVETVKKLQDILNKLKAFLFTEDAFVRPDKPENEDDIVKMRYWKEKEKDSVEYSYILDTLNSAASLKMPISSLFSIFVGLLDKKRFSSQGKEKGIPVFAYGQDYLLESKYHFVFGINSKNIERKEGTNSYLDGYELEGNETDIVVTEALINSYLNLQGSYVKISGSHETYSGYVGLPSTILKASSSENKTIDTTYKSKVQKISDITFYKALPIKGKLDNKALSYSTIDNYISCPFKIYGKEIMGLGNKGDRQVFEPQDNNFGALGTALHEVVQRFLLENRGKTLESSQVALYKETLKKYVHEQFLNPEAFREQLLQLIAKENQSRLDNIFEVDDYMKNYYINTYERSVSTFMTKLFNKYNTAFIPKGVEVQKTCREGSTIIGFIDVWLEDISGKIYLIDLKSSKGAEKAKKIQLDLYNYILKQNGIEQEVVLLYFDFKEGNFYESDPMESDAVENLNKKEKLAIHKEITLEGLTQGLWTIKANNDGCRYCNYYSFCRGRFCDVH
ncbi:MAG: PD-(D/E)XK nuclease family protein [Sphaerochaetaceae bacterium]|nr:PD-(D/E)XK nuclease family protein [Sphaerochaetaceae bacterium]